MLAKRSEVRRAGERGSRAHVMPPGMDIFLRPRPFLFCTSTPTPFPTLCPAEATTSRNRGTSQHGAAEPRQARVGVSTYQELPRRVS